MEVVQAFKGSDAVAIAEKTPNILILLDYDLPDMSGRDVIRSVSGRNSDVPFIVVTGRGSEGIAVGMMKLGAREYYVKSPELIDKLPYIIKRVISDVHEEIKNINTHILLKLALEETDEGFWEWDVATGKIDLNENWQRILGYEPGEIEFDIEWWDKNIHAESKSVFERALNDYLEGRTKDYELEYQIRSKTGEWKWIWARGIVIKYDQNNKPLKMIGTHREITRIKKSENEIAGRMKELEEFYDMSVKRELKMKELKEKIHRLELELSQYRMKSTRI